MARLPGTPPTEEVSVQPGYAYKKGSTVEAQGRRPNFDLFTDGEHAWTRNDDDDRALIGAMKGGSTMTVKGTSCATPTPSTPTRSAASPPPTTRCAAPAGNVKTSGGNAGGCWHTKRMAARA